jgi:hypothetical protein
MEAITLFIDGEPVEQPLDRLGYWYSQVERAWQAGNETGIPRERVAAACGVDADELLRWEAATDRAMDYEEAMDYGDL